MAEVPKHIGIIMDGNRRFAKRLMIKPWNGHEYGAKKVQKVMEWCKEIGCKELTLYAFSVENFNRPEHEFNYLMDLFRKEFDNIQKEESIMLKLFKVNKKEFFENKQEAKVRRRELNGLNKEGEEMYGTGFTVACGPDHWRS